MSFVHLHNHTHYSLLDAIIKPIELITAAKEAGQPAVALTDHGVMFGVVEFYKECKKQGIKPIIGIEAYMAGGSRKEKPQNTMVKSEVQYSSTPKDAGGLFIDNSQSDGAMIKQTNQPQNVKPIKERNYYHIILLAKNNTGYQNLLKLTSLSFSEGHYKKPRIDKEILEQYKEGLICTSACMGGIINADIIGGDLEKAREEAHYYKNLFGDDFYMELQRHGYDNDERLIAEAAKIAKEINAKLICTNDIHYLKKEHAIAHNILLNISSKSVNDYKRLRYGTDDFYFKTTEEMQQLFHDYPEAVSNTMEIADKCNFDLELNVLHMPQYPIPETSSATNLNDYLKELSYEMMEKTRLNGEPLADEYRERMEFELSIIKQMDFPGYFLIVQDFINEAKKRGVPVGPGRGSAAGSLVAFALGITNIDPLKFNLLFERFLNPERVSMPDIDIDFCDEKRDVVMEYVKEKYGEEAVAQIVTFSKLTMKAVIQDVGRVLDIPLSEVRKITAPIPMKGTVINGHKIKKLKDALEYIPELEYLQEKMMEEPIFKELIDIAMVLEDTNRGRGTHAAGVIIAPGPVSNFIPTCTPIASQKPADGESLGCDVVTQFQNSGGEVEECGLLKMDFLGLRTLSIIERAIDMVEKNHGLKIDIDEIPLDDPDTFDLLGRGETQAIFQFESDGMQEYLKQLKPKSIEELTAMNALYRPGPMENIPEYIDVKFKRKKMNCYHDDLIPFLEETYGVIVYQEQVMQIGQKMAGFSLGYADVMRRIMGKKKPDAMAKLKPDFIAGFEKEGYGKKLAEELWKELLPFCDYGFNKSHAVAYSYVAYQTAWLKTHYPAEFYASNMTAVMNDQAKVATLIEEASKHNISLKPPNINISDAYFYAPNGNEVYYGLAGIKNVGIPIVEAVSADRAKQPYSSFFDFCARSDKKVLNKRAIEALICAGAFDEITDGKRRPLFESIEDGIEYSKAVERAHQSSNASIFGSMDEGQIPEPELPVIEDWDEKTRLRNEKDFLSFYLTGHPIKIYDSILRELKFTNIGDLQELQDETEVKTCGLIDSIQIKTNKKGQHFAVITISDALNNKVECVIWNDAYEEVSYKLQPDTVVLISGVLKSKGEKVSISLDDLYSIDELIQKNMPKIRIYLNVENGAVEKIEHLLSSDKNFVSTLNQECIDEPTKIIFNCYKLTDTNYRNEYFVNISSECSIDTITWLSKIFDVQEKGNVKPMFKLPTIRVGKRNKWKN